MFRELFFDKANTAVSVSTHNELYYECELSFKSVTEKWCMTKLMIQIPRDLFGKIVIHDQCGRLYTPKKIESAFDFLYDGFTQDLLDTLTKDDTEK
jgi:hypothetical protein